MADEVRLIDAELLTTNIAQIAKACAKSDKQKALIGRILFMIENMPTVEAEPVKHGRWETWGYIFHGIAWKRCSVCGKTADVSYQALLDGKIEMATPSICGCCGYRMDGDSE